MKLQDQYFESDKISQRLKYSIRRIIGKFCSFEELLNFEQTLLKRVDGVKSHQELEKLLLEIIGKKVFDKDGKVESRQRLPSLEKKVKKALTK